MFQQLLAQITNEYSLLFYVRQVIVTLVLFVYGYVACALLFGRDHAETARERSYENMGLHNSIIANTRVDTNTTGNISYFIYCILLAFPTGLSVFGICGLLLLVIGVKYCVLSVIISMLLFLILVFIINSMATKNSGNPIQISLSSVRNKLFFGNSTWLLICIGITVIIAVLVSVSGIISLGFSNDSMYYYSEYPRAIVNRGYLYYGFDAYLTDAGQTTVVINTLPYLFGFDETFGIHTFFNINFIVFFAYAIYEQAHKFFDRKKSLVFSVLFTLILVTSMPFILISKWNIANVYFMEQMFICLYLYFKSNYEQINLNVILTILMTMLSFMRIEGALYVALVLLCAMAFKSETELPDTSLTHSSNALLWKKRSIIFPAVCVLIFQAAYFSKIFVFMKIYASYTFMTKEKALIIIAVYVLLIIYGCIFADDGKIGYNKTSGIFWNKTEKSAAIDKGGFLKGMLLLLKPNAVLYIIVLVAANIAVFLYDSESYLENVRALILNVMQNSGWGFFPAVVVAFIILVPKVRIKNIYFDLFYICFALMSVIACSLRGGTLRISFADSGNRVFLQIVPFIAYAFAYRFIISLKTVEKRQSELK